MERVCYQRVKNILVLTLITIFTFFLGFSTVSFAETGNIFVEDNANILSNQDKDIIKNMNEEEFVKLPGKPQYVVVTLNNLDGYDSVEDYAEKKFKELGIGNKELDNGFLFVISVDDRKYRLETGYGVEDVITDSMKEDVVTEKATDLLQDEQYGSAVMLISKNVQSLVNKKYGDVDAAKRLIEQEKAQKKKFIQTILYIIIGFVLLILIGVLWYQMKVTKVRKVLTKNYLDKNLEGYVFIDKTNQFTGMGKGIKKVILPNYLAKTLNLSAKKQTILIDRAGMIDWLAQYLLVDGLIQYWRKAKKEAPYDISIYLETKYLDSLKGDLLSESGNFNYPLKSNPYLRGESVNTISDYVNETTQKHAKALKISSDNKKFIEKLCQQFLSESGVRLSRVNKDLQIALMIYYFLKGKDLSDPQLLQKVTINNQELSKAYRFADKKRKEIASDQRQQALNDLTDMTLGSYYMQSMIWSSYSHSSNDSSFGGGGGSSFGGGSSGGGGFSGGW